MTPRLRLSPGSYLSLHLAAGLLLCILFLWVFGDITEDVLTNDSLVTADIWLNSWIPSLRSGPLNTSMVLATQLGGAVFVLLAGTGIVAFLLVRKHPDRAAGLAAAVLGGQVLNTLLKVLIQRPRPASTTALVHAMGWSFPSGHAMMSMIFYGMAAYLVVRSGASRRVKICAVAMSGFLVLVIGFSRIYLHVHYLSDVLAGYAGGLFWLTVCVTGLEEYGARKRQAVQGSR